MVVDHLRPPEFLSDPFQRRVLGPNGTQLSQKFRLHGIGIDKREELVNQILLAGQAQSRSTACEHDFDELTLGPTVVSNEHCATTATLRRPIVGSHTQRPDKPLELNPTEWPVPEQPHGGTNSSNSVSERMIARVQVNPTPCLS